MLWFRTNYRLGIKLCQYTRSRYSIETLVYKKSFFVLWCVGVISSLIITTIPSTVVSYEVSAPVLSATTVSLKPVIMTDELPAEAPAVETIADMIVPTALYHDVPFYSQFADITPVAWQKVGCGIASTAMLIDFYSTEVVNVDSLLQQGIAASAFLSDAGWTHQGLINLTKQFGLNGASVSLSHLTMEAAFASLETVVTEGPVMVSVHYTFQPTNPIPHLAVVTGIDDERVYYNDPAELQGGGDISIAQFKSAWKKRYIEILPAL
jgi:hypothetical protein